MSIAVLPLNIKQSGSMWETKEMPPPLAFRHGGCEGCPGLKQLNPEMEELMEWRAGVGQAHVQSKKRHHSPFSSAFSTTGEFPNIPQAIFRCFFIKTKCGFSSLRWLGCKSRVLSLGQTAAGLVPWIVNMCHLKPKLEVQWSPWDSWI